MTVEAAVAESAPLLRAQPLRALVVLALFAAGLCAVVAAAVATLADAPGSGGGLLLTAALVALAAAPGACWACEQGRWSPYGPIAAFQAACSALLIAAHLAAALYCARHAADAIGARGPYGATVLEVVAWLVATAAGLLLLALLVASVPLAPGVRRQLRWLPAAVATLAAAVAAMAGGTQLLARDCDAFAFETDRWRAALAGDASDRDAQRIVAAVARCGTVDGLGRAELLATLGRPSARSGGTWTWIGPGPSSGLFATAPSLAVTLADGHVATATADGGGGD